MKPSTPDLMKFKRLQRKLKESTRGVVGLLELLWIGTGKNAPRGDIGKMTNEEIAIMVDWSGDADVLVDSLVECGWLDTDKESRLIVHDWHQHAPSWVKGNVLQHLGGFVVRSPAGSPQGIVLKEVPKGPSLGDSPSSPVQSSPNQTLECCEVDKSPQQPPAKDPKDCAYPEFPCIRGKHCADTEWVLSAEFLETLRECYPGVNVELQSKRAHAWVQANLSRRKTAEGMQKFLLNWMAKELAEFKKRAKTVVEPSEDRPELRKRTLSQVKAGVGL